MIKQFEKILDKAGKYGYNNASEWGLSSAGRASALQAEGHRFEPCRPHYPGSVKASGFYTLFIWRGSSVGKSTRFIPVVSLVRLQFPLLRMKIESSLDVRVFDFFFLLGAT